MTFFQVTPDGNIPQMLTLTVRYFENVEDQRRNEETELKLILPSEIGLHMAEQIINAVQLSKMPPTNSSVVN